MIISGSPEALKHLPGFLWGRGNPLEQDCPSSGFSASQGPYRHYRTSEKISLQFNSRFGEKVRDRENRAKERGAEGTGEKLARVSRKLEQKSLSPVSAAWPA